MNDDVVELSSSCKLSLDTWESLAPDLSLEPLEQQEGDIPH